MWCDADGVTQEKVAKTDCTVGTHRQGKPTEGGETQEWTHEEKESEAHDSTQHRQDTLQAPLAVRALQEQARAIERGRDVARMVV